MENKTLSGKDLSKRVPAMDERIKWINCFIKQSAEIAEYDIGDDQREDRSSEEIVNTKNGLCVINQNDRAYFIWSCGIKSIVRYEYHPYLGLSNCYVIQTNDENKGAVIYDAQITSKQTLKYLLSNAFGVEVKKYQSDKRTNELLMAFFRKNATVYEIPLYGGWQLIDQKWHFLLINEKTHYDNLIQGFLVRDVAAQPQQSGNPYKGVYGGMGANYSSLRESLNLIKDRWVRRKLWLYIHAAAVCSLLKQHGIEFNTGLCIYSDSLKVRTFIEELLALYNDTPLSLADSKEKIADQLIMSKDQLILIRDEDSPSANERYCRELLRIGKIKNPRWRKDQFLYAILGIPVVVSDGKSEMKDCEKLNHVTIDEFDLVHGAIEKLKTYKQGIKLYIESFISEVAHDSGFIADIKKYIDQAFEQTPQDLGLRRDAVITIGVLNGIQAKFSEYWKKVPQYGFVNRLEYEAWIDPKEYGVFYQQTEEAGTQDVDLAELFWTTARSLIEKSEIKIMRRNMDNRFCYKESSVLAPEILMDPDYTYIPTRAFSQICKACQISSKKMAQTLEDQGLFFDGVKAVKTFKARVGIHPDNINYTQLYAYKVETWRLQETDILERSEDDPYQLCLGQDIHGRKRMWGGGYNSHIRITGCSGTGKSYLLRYLAGQLPAQGVKCIILDSSGDFSNPRGRQPEGWPVEGVRIVNMREDPIELISFAPKDDEETIADIISRISTTISVALGFGKRQTGHLTERISYGLQSEKLKEFKDLKELLNTHGRGSQSANSVYSAMDGLWDVFPTGAKSFDWEFDKAGITIINLHEAYGENAEKIVVEMLLGELSSKRMRNSMTDMPPLVLIMDECQRLCWNENSFASKLMKESRKYGISIWAGTQSLGKKTISNALGQCSLQLAFKPDADGVSSLSKELTDFNKALFNKCAMRLRSLGRGEFLYVKNGEIIVASAP